ncbi:MAG: YceI family protein [Bacteroidota bacterium]|nr:YceI family protein [Bacteroidota bacterium]
MKRFMLIPALFIAFTLSAFSQSSWSFDKAHTTIGFEVTHLVITEVEGHFNSYEGTVKTKGEDFEGASVKFTVDVASIDTDNEKRDEHLRSDDFFNAEKFPKMTFTSKSMKKTGKNTYTLVGDLKIRDVTKQVELDVKHNGTVQDPWGNTKAGFKMSGTLNRFDYNLKWNKMTEMGGAVVGKEVRLDIDVQLMMNKS